MANERSKRKDHIVALLGQTSEMSVNEIADILKVSTMTIRRYLHELEEEGLVRRLHGKALLLNMMSRPVDPYVLGKQIEKNAELKSKIGAAAASLVRPDEMIFLDSGSTTPFIAKSINAQMHLNVLCYTFQNALEFYNRPNTKLILSGGYYDRDSNIFYSNKSLEIIKDLRADTAFISTAGVDKDLGLTTYFYFEADIKKALIASAKRVVLVTDSTKFGKVSITYFTSIQNLDVVVTDEGIPDEYRNFFVEQGIELIIV